MEFIVFLLCAAVIVLVINTVKLRNRYLKTEDELRALRHKANDLNDKAFFMYSILKNMGVVPGVSPDKPERAEEQKEAAAQPTGVVLSKTQPTEQRAAAPIANESPQAQPVVLPQTAPSPVAAPPAAVQQAAETQPAPQAQTQQSAPAVPYGAPYQNVRQQVQPQHTPQPAVKPAPAKPKRHVEEWLGARLFNIAASVLIFIGLVLFCTLSTEQVTNTMKMIAMFVVSGGFIGVGAFLARKDRSVFPLGMLGTGFGSFFISILLSHIYFHSLGDIAAFSLILVWSALALFLSKKLDSVMLSVTAHIGTAVSICFAYSLGFTAEKVMILTIYQFAAITVIIAGNIFCCRKTYRFGLIMSQCLLLYTSIAMSAAFSEKFIMPQAISAAFAIVIYAVQFIAISFVSYLVSASAAALEKQGGGMTTAATFIHCANKLLWAGGTIASVGCITYYVCKHALHVGTVVPTTSALAIAALLHLALTLLMEEKLSFSEHLASLSIWAISIMISVSLIIGAYETGLPFVFIYALLLAGILKYTKNKSITPIAAAVLLIEGVYMCFYGYFKAENVWVSIPYMFGMGVVLLLLWFVQDGKDKQRYFKYMKISEYLWISASIIPINASEFSDISVPLIISEFALMNIICWFIKFGSENEPELRTVVKVESLLTVYIGIFALSFEFNNALGTNSIIKAVLCVMVFIITAIYVYDFARSNLTLLKVISALTMAGYVTSLAFGFRDHFKPFFYYVDTLSGLPFVFVFTVTLLCIYALTKDHKLTLFLWIGIILDMLIMGFGGYSALVDAVTLGEDPALAPHIIMTGVSLAHAAAALGFSFIMGSFAEENKLSGKMSASVSKFVSYFWINLAFPTVTYWAFYRTDLSYIKWLLALMILTAVNTAVFALDYQDRFSSKFNICVRVTSSIVYYIALVNLAAGSGVYDAKYVCVVILTLICAALFFVKARELMKNTTQTWAHVLVGINATLFANAACEGLSGEFDAAYIFSIVTMLTALLCITAGFIAKAKGLRVYGLIVTMICIIKLVTFDISGADSLARVLAFIIGGIICFIISGIYNKMEKRFTESVPVSVPIMQTAAQTVIQQPQPAVLENTDNAPTQPQAAPTAFEAPAPAQQNEAPAETAAEAEKPETTE